MQYPEIFYDNTKISSIFGIFPGSIWNGGSTYLEGRFACKNRMQDIIATYNEVYNIPLRFTFTNPCLEKNDIFDRYSNAIAEAGNNGKNEILVVSPILEEYLRKEYPNYKFVRSIIGSKDDDPEHFSYNDDYYMMVSKRSLNNNWDYLDSIPEKYRTKIEFLCNDPCPDNCPYIYSHYSIMGDSTLSWEWNNEGGCKMRDEIGFFSKHKTTQRKSYISRQMIDEIYYPKGFNQFKISGRWNPLTILLDLVTYLIKPEYQFDVIQNIGNSIFNL